MNQISDDEVLDLADWVAHSGNRAVANDLEEILAASGSAWRMGVRNGNVGLERRLPESVRTAADQVIGTGSAGAIFGEAWTALYSRNPDPEEAYEKAIKAVEEAGAAIVSPKSGGATLGTMSRDMKSQSDWKIDLPGRQVDVAVAMAEALWSGQESRHGGNGYRRPTQGEAETAVILALVLIQLFSAGSLARRP